MEYTERIDGFQIRDPCYLFGRPDDAPIMFDIVKWVQTKPREVTDLRTGRKKISTEYCYTVARLTWNKKEQCFEFSSIGMRWLCTELTKAVIDLILDFAEKKGIELCESD